MPGSKALVDGFSQEIALRSVFSHVLHFPSFSMLSCTRNSVILRISGSGKGFSSGNWIDPLAVLNFASSSANAFTADGVG